MARKDNRSSQVSRTKARGALNGAPVASPLRLIVGGAVDTVAGMVFVVAGVAISAREILFHLERDVPVIELLSSLSAVVLPLVTVLWAMLSWALWVIEPHVSVLPPLRTWDRQGDQSPDGEDNVV